MNPQWRKINKRSGNIKRAWKKKYQEIVANNPEIVCSDFNGSRPDTRPDTTEIKNQDRNSISMEFHFTLRLRYKRFYKGCIVPPDSVKQPNNAMILAFLNFPMHGCHVDLDVSVKR